VIKKKN